MEASQTNESREKICPRCRQPLSVRANRPEGNGRDFCSNCGFEDTGKTGTQILGGGRADKGVEIVEQGNRQ